MRVEILDAEGQPLPQGVPGRIFVGNGARFEGYTDGGNKEQRRGLLSSGDMGHLDADGYLYVDGRDDDMIVSGGENLFPSEVEELLNHHPKIHEAAVVGVPDAEFGQVLAAFVVKRAAGPAQRRTGAHVRPRAPRQVQGAEVGDVPRRAAAQRQRQDPQAPPRRRKLLMATATDRMTRRVTKLALRNADSLAKSALYPPAVDVLIEAGALVAEQRRLADTVATAACGRSSVVQRRRRKELAERRALDPARVPPVPTRRRCGGTRTGRSARRRSCCSTGGPRPACCGRARSSTAWPSSTASCASTTAARAGRAPCPGR